jgi:hypothetical protein
MVIQLYERISFKGFLVLLPKLKKSPWTELYRRTGIASTMHSLEIN